MSVYDVSRYKLFQVMFIVRNITFTSMSIANNDMVNKLSIST